MSQAAEISNAQDIARSAWRTGRIGRIFTCTKKETYQWVIAIGLLVLIIVFVVVAAVLSKKGGDDNPVMFFAMHLGDQARVRCCTANQSSDFMEFQCNIKLNIDNTRTAIEKMNDMKQMYAYIFYTDSVETTPSMIPEEALKHLDTVEAKAGSSYSQKSVLKAFTNRLRNNDLLVYYVPCNFDYRKNQDVVDFIDEMRRAEIGDLVLIVSNTQTSNVAAEVYEQDFNHAVGIGQDIPGRISEFARHPRTKTTVTPKQTTVYKTTTHSTRSQTHNVTTSLSTTTESPRTHNVTTSLSTTTESPREISCLFVGDLYNYDSRQGDYDLESQLLGEVAYDIFDEFRALRIGLWLYGYTYFPTEVVPSQIMMSTNYTGFRTLLYHMNYFFTHGALNTARAIDALNAAYDLKHLFNCVVFCTAQYRTTHLPSLGSRLGNVVAVGLSGTNPEEVVPWDGRVVSVPYYYDESHIRAIVRAIVEPKTTTKKAVSTTPNSAIRLH